MGFMKVETLEINEAGQISKLALLFPDAFGRNLLTPMPVPDQARPGCEADTIVTELDINDLTHEELMGRVACHKDRAAFKLLFDHFAPRIKSHLMSLGLPAHPAEDLTQDVLVKVWRKAHQFDGGKARLSTWIFRIARNAFIDSKRKAKYPEVNADDHLHEMPATEETDRPVIQQQDAARVKLALATLKPIYKQVIELSFYEELSHSQISDRLSLPLGTVKSRIRLAFSALRKELGECA